MKFWLCSTNATDAPRLDLDLLKLLEEAKTKIRVLEAIKMVEAAYVKLKDHLWYLSDRLVLLALFYAWVADRDKTEMANKILKYENQTRPDCQEMPETETFWAKRLKHLVEPDS